MERRAFIAGVAGSILAMPVAGETEQVGETVRVGFLDALKE